MSFFELRTPRDMLEKARREYQRLDCHFDIDNVFNFFVTAYHIQDYIAKMEGVGSDKPSKDTLNKFFEDDDMKDCRALCDKGKHLTLTRRSDPITTVWTSRFGDAPLGVMRVGGDDVFMLFIDERKIDVKLLAKRVLIKWEDFFEQNGL